MPLAVIAHSARWTRERRIAELLIVLWIIGLGDLWLTLWAHQYTAFMELNPLANALLSGQQNVALIAFKIASMTIATLALWLTRRTRRCECATWAMTIVYFALLLQWSDYTRGILALGR